eukprot:UN03022
MILIYQQILKIRITTSLVKLNYNFCCKIQITSSVVKF